MTHMRISHKSISIIIPCYNEAENLEAVMQATFHTAKNIEGSFEILFVNDGSTDDSGDKLNAFAEKNPNISVIHLTRNHGQSAALQAGFDHAKGDIIVTMDADLQNDPTDIPMLLEELEKGYNLVYGWRKDRDDAYMRRKIPSCIANRLIACVTGFPAHDIGCGLKAMRKDVLAHMMLIGDFHRFIPVLAYWQGARCKEICVRHHPRRNGISKYGMERTIKVILDLITVKFFITYVRSPMRLFGRYGLLLIFTGIIAGCIALVWKLTANFNLTGNPLSLLAIFFVLIGVQFVFLGMLGELCAHIYLDRNHQVTYSIRKKINLD